MLKQVELLIFYPEKISWMSLNTQYCLKYQGRIGHLEPIYYELQVRTL